jgi:hypothetical protein
MSNLTIKVDVLAGTDLEETILQAKELAQKLNIAYVCFDFNNVEFSIGQSANVEEAIEKFSTEYKKKNGLVVQP